MYGDYTPGPDRRRYRDTRVSPSSIGQYPTEQTRYEDSRQTRYDDRRRYVTPSPEPLPLPHGSDVEDKRPTYVHGSRHHGYPKHVFTGRRDYGDKNYYFTDTDNNLVNPGEGKLREYRVVRNKPERSDKNGDFYINSDIEDDEDDIYDRTKVKGVKGHRVHVKIEHWRGMIGQKKYNDLKLIVEELYEDGQVTIEEKIGWLDTFEVYINNQLMYSRMHDGGYPRTGDILHQIKRARHGRTVRRIRSGETKICTIL